MKLFSSLHDVKNKKYAMYYSGVLVIIVTIGVVLYFDLFRMSILERSMMYFEGFFSLFMLARHEEVGKAFLLHLAKLEKACSGSISHASEKFFVLLR